MRPEPLLAALEPGTGPRWRVGVVRTAGQSARLAAAEVIDQLRAAGCMATEIDVSRTDPFIDHRAEWAGGAHADAYDLITVVGDPSPAVVALAVLVDAPVVSLPIGIMESVTTAIERAVARSHVDAQSVAEVTVDDHRRFCTGAVVVTPDCDTEVRWLEGSAWRRATTSGCQICPADRFGGSLQLLLPDTAPIPCRRVELHGDEVALRVDFDTRSRRARHVVVEALARPLCIVRLEQGP